MRLTYYRVELMTLTPVAVTAPQASDFARHLAARTGRDGTRDAGANLDLPIFRSASGAPAIPSSTLAGSLRAAMPEALRPVLMGTVEATAVPSTVLVLGGEVGEATASSVTVTRRTAIDRRRGAARTSTFHDGEALVAGSSIVVRLVAEDLGQEQEAALDRALSDWQPRLGRGISSGAGIAEVKSIGKGTLDLAAEPDLLLYLNGGGPELVDIVAARGSVAVRARRANILVTETFEIVDGIHVGSGDSDGNALLVVRDEKGRPVVPGSSLKGVLRSRCEYILRSIGVGACLEGHCGVCPTCALFGHSLKEPAVDGRLGTRGLVAVRDAAIEGANETRRPHVAIDRVTGGVLDRALYGTGLIDEGQLTVRIEALADPPTWAEGLILAALADLDEGHIGLGGGVTRGQGTVRSVGGPITARCHKTIAHSIATLRAAAMEAN